MRFLILAMALLVAGCDERQDLCDKAVETAMKDKPSYKLLEVIPDWKEREVEGKGISEYKYIYRYYIGSSELHVEGIQCIYGDGDQQVEIYGKREFELR